MIWNKLCHGVVYHYVPQRYKNFINWQKKNIAAALRNTDTMKLTLTVENVVKGVVKDVAGCQGDTLRGEVGK